MSGDRVEVQRGLPKPGPALRVVLISLLVLWLVFALALNWGGASGESFFLFTGNTEAISRGQIWRLLTASLLHMPTGEIGHILSALLGLYFLGSSLEQTWGGQRFVRFLIASSVLAYTTQFLIAWALGSSVSSRLVPGHYFGAIPAVEAVAIAWACSFRGRTVHLFFVLPISATGLILFVLGINLMLLIAGATPASGHVALFAGMAWGYLLGGGTPSPLRKFYLRYRLARLEAETRSEGQAKKRRTRASGLRVIEGGKDGKGGDKRMLH